MTTGPMINSSRSDEPIPGRRALAYVAAALAGDPEPGNRSASRTALLRLAWLKTALVALGVPFALLISAGQDPAGRGMLAGLIGFGLLYWTALVLPALLIARRGRPTRLGFALILVPDLLLVLASFVL